MFKFKGVVPPIITPLTAKRQLDEEGLRRLVSRCMEKGLDGVYVAGSTGEVMSLTNEQRRKAIQVCLCQADGKIPVYAGIIDSATDRAVENLRMLEQMGGQYAVLTPAFYVKNASQNEILRHFETVARQTSLKVIAYNIPSNTHVNILPETVRKLAQIDNVMGIKDSSGNWSQFQRILDDFRGSDFAIFQGIPEYAGISILMGACGYTPLYSILFPQLFKRLYRSAATGDVAETIKYQKSVSELADVLKLGISPISVQKYAISTLGITGKTAAYPCEPLKAAEEAAIDNFLAPFFAMERELEREEDMARELVG